jgi:hypothetical protein
MACPSLGALSIGFQDMIYLKQKAEASPSAGTVARLNRDGKSHFID